MFRRRTMMLMMGQKAERMREERRREEEMGRMRTDLRGLRRQQGRLTRQEERTLAKQQRWAADLKAEARETRLDLDVAKRGLYRCQDKQRLQELQERLEASDACKSQITRIRRDMSDLNRQIHETERAIQETYKTIADRKREYQRFRVPRLEKVDDRYDLAVKNLGSQLEDNRRMVAEIHHLCLEKAMVGKVHEQLEHQMTLLNKELTGNVEAAREMYIERDTTKRGMDKLVEHFEKQTLSTKLDLDNLDFQIDVLRHTERFAVEKNKVRLDEFAQKLLALRGQTTPNELESLMYKHAQEVMREAARRSGGSGGEGGGGDVGEVVRTYLQLTEENYMLYKNVKESRDRTRERMNEIESLQNQIAEKTANNVKEKRAERAEKAKLLAKIKIYQHKADEREKKVARADQVIQTYITSIRKILTDLGYTPKDILEMAGVYGKIEDRNISVFLAAIEKFVGKLWELQTFVEFEALEKKRAGSIMRPPPPEPLPPRMRLLHRVAIVAPDYEEEAVEFRHGSTIDHPFSWQEVTRAVKEDLDGTGREGEGERETEGEETPEFFMDKPSITDFACDLFDRTPSTSSSTDSP